MIGERSRRRYIIAEEEEVTRILPTDIREAEREREAGRGRKRGLRRKAKVGTKIKHHKKRRRKEEELV